MTEPEVSPAALRLELLASPRLVRNDGTVIAVLERRDAAMLAVLALEGATTRVRLAALLWPDSDPRRAGISLRQRLFRLKRAAGREVVIGDRTVELATNIESDVACSQAKRHDAGELLGTFEYAGCDELATWVEQRRHQRRARRRQAIAEEAEHLESEGQLAQALECAERLVIEEPLAEHAYRRVMRLHYLRGDRSAALATFESCRRSLKTGLNVEPCQETAELAAVIARSGHVGNLHGASRPVTLLRPPRLVGREEEWRLVESTWSSEQSVLLQGDPGIGKSRMLGELATAHTGAICIAARPGDASVPYSVLARVLREAVQRFGGPLPAWAADEIGRLLPELGVQGPGVLNTVRLHQSVAASMADWRGRGMQALLVDDLQFADEASLEWLFAFVAQRDGAAPRVALAVRAGEVPASIRQWIEEDASACLAVIQLRALDGKALEQLLDSLELSGLDPSAWVAPLLRHTGGNPMFVLQTLLAMQLGGGQSIGDSASFALLPVPKQVGQLLDRRILSLTPAALRLAQVAGLAGPDFSAQLAAKVLEVHLLELSGAWQELETAQLMSHGAFAHDLIFEAARRSVPQPVAMPMHRAIALAAAELGAPAARVAEHWWRAGEWAPAALHYERSAAEALSASRRDQELKQLEMAADCMRRLGDRAAEFRLMQLATEPALVVEPTARVVERVQALHRLAVEDTERLDAWLMQAKVEVSGSGAPGHDSVREAYALAQRCGDAVRLGKASRFVAVDLVLRGRSADAIELLEQQLPEIQRLGDERLEHDFLADYSYVLGVGDRRHRAVVVTEQCIALAEKLGDYNEVIIHLNNLANAQGFLGRPEAAMNSVVRAAELRERLGEADGLVQAISTMNVGVHCMHLGRYGQALESLERSLPQFAAFGDTAVTWFASNQNMLALTWMALGQTTRAKQTLTEMAPNVAGFVAVRRQVVRSRADQLVGQAAVDLLRSALAMPGANSIQQLLTQLALAAVLPPEEAAPLCESVRHQALAAEHDAIALHALLRRAHALSRTGAHALAMQLAQDALQEENCVAYDMTPAEFAWLAYQVFTAGDDRDGARKALETGSDWLRSKALPLVPEPFRESFLHRHPVNRLLLTTADRELR